MLGALTDREIPVGDAGIKATLHRMAVLARRGIRDEQILVLSRHITQSAPVADKAAEAKAIFDWMVKNIRYVTDPVHIEFIMSPAKLLTEVKAGDCDDLSIAMAALAEAVGIPARFVAVKTGANKRFNHVYPELYINGRWIAYDIANVSPDVGKTTPNTGERLVQPVTVDETQPPSLEEFSGTVKVVGAAIGLVMVIGALFLFERWRSKRA
jgi:hypothetical protein